MPEYTESLGIEGTLVLELFDEDGNLKDYRVVKNLITDAGDNYIAGKVITGIAPASPSAPTAANGMKLGTGSTAAAKNGAGAALATYLAGTNVAFDTSYPLLASLGAGLGTNAVYRTTFSAGVGTGALTECALVNDAGSNGTATAANTYARTVFAVVNKGATDVLIATWNHKALGV